MKKFKKQFNDFFFALFALLQSKNIKAVYEAHGLKVVCSVKKKDRVLWLVVSDRVRCMHLIEAKSPEIAVDKIYRAEQYRREEK